MFPVYRNENLGQPPINSMISMLREFGVGILAASQSAELDNCIFSNTYCKILFPLGSDEDSAKMQKAMGLTQDQIKYIHKLKRGEAILRCGEYPDPVVIQIPRFPLG